MRRVLVPGGRLLLVDGFRDNAIGWFVFDVIAARLKKNIHHASWQSLQKLFETAGFINIYRRKTNLLLPLLATVGEVPQ